MIKSAAYSDSAEAKAERDRCDYSIKISLHDALNGTAKRRPRVYADGVFDLYHFGHARLFKQIKEMVPDAYTVSGGEAWFYDVFDLCHFGHARLFKQIKEMVPDAYTVSGGEAWFYGVFDLCHFGHARLFKQIKEMVPDAYTVSGGETSFYGVFDLYHFGHARLFKQIKEMVPDAYTVSGGEAWFYGVFDLYHFDHARLFKQIKEMVPDAYTVSGVMTQENTIKFKGNPVMTAKERAESMLHCRYVDEVIYDAPWDTTFEFMEEMKLDFMAHDALPYHQSDGEDPYRKFRDAGRFIATKRTEDISTTELIGRIVLEHENYEQRYMNGAANTAIQNGLDEASEKREKGAVSK